MERLGRTLLSILDIHSVRISYTDAWLFYDTNISQQALFLVVNTWNLNFTLRHKVILVDVIIKKEFFCEDIGLRVRRFRSGFSVNYIQDWSVFVYIEEISHFLSRSISGQGTYVTLSSFRPNSQPSNLPFKPGIAPDMIW